MHSAPQDLPDDVDVVIVGLGPVGKLLAILIGRTGKRVVVVDRQARGYPLPRAVTHDSEFARILQSIGLAPDVIPEVTEPYDDMYVWRNAAEQTLVEVDWSGIGPSGWYSTYFFNQPALEERMETVLGEFPTVHPLRGWTVSVERQDEQSVTAALFEDASGETRTVTARYLIGADGARSRIRDAAGIPWHDLGFYYDWLVVDVVPDPSLHFPHVAIQTCDIARPATMVPGGPGRRRWEFMRLPTETIDSLNRTERAWELLQPFGIDPGNAALERHSVYTFQAGYATQWRSGRILLAGDAAHQMPPFAGQGLGAGFRDAMNLHWKLNAVLEGKASDALLDSYASERLPHIREFIDFSIALGRVICITDPTEAAARDARMIAEIPTGSKLDAPPAPRLGPPFDVDGGGSLSPQGRIRIGDEVRLFDDLVRGAALLAREASCFDALSAETLQAATDFPVTLVGLHGSSPNALAAQDVDGVYEAWLDRLGMAAVLIRPDFSTFGTVEGDGVERLLRRFARALVDPSDRTRSDRVASDA